MQKHLRGKVTLYCADCREILPKLDADSFDASLNDPPYGLSFVGKAWDRALPPTEIWEQLFRVLKPGAHMIAFGGPRTFHRLACCLEDAGFHIRDCLAWIYAGNWAQGLDLARATGETAWEGYRTALKNSWEPLLLSMKPTEGTFAQNVLKWGVGALNIDGTRLPVEDEEASVGRYPANLALDEDCARQVDKQGRMMGIHSAGAARKRVVESTYNASSYHAPVHRQMDRYGDTGGASRFFYCPKASKSERGKGNDHPTVKPVRLCEYMAKLLLPPKLDRQRRIIVPFAGSGSEIVAALSAGWDEVIGIESDPNYFAIACDRLSAWQ